LGFFGTAFDHWVNPANCDPTSGSPEHRANLRQVKLLQAAAHAAL